MANCRILTSPWKNRVLYQKGWIRPATPQWEIISIMSGQACLLQPSEAIPLCEVINVPQGGTELRRPIRVAHLHLIRDRAKSRPESVDRHLLSQKGNGVFPASISSTMPAPSICSSFSQKKVNNVIMPCSSFPDSGSTHLTVSPRC